MDTRRIPIIRMETIQETKATELTFIDFSYEVALEEYKLKKQLEISSKYIVPIPKL